MQALIVAVAILALVLQESHAFRATSRVTTCSPSVSTQQRQHSQLTMKDVTFGSKVAGLLLASAAILGSNSAPAFADRPLNAPSAAGTRVNSDPGEC